MNEIVFDCGISLCGVTCGRVDFNKIMWFTKRLFFESKKSLKALLKAQF